MSALDKIIEGIHSQAQAKADEIIRQANEQAAETTADSKAKCQKRKQELDEITQRELLEITKRAAASNQRNRRLAMLEVKNQAIDDAINEAKEILQNSPNKELFKSVWEGKVFINNSIDAIFQANEQALRDKAYEVLSQ